VPLARAGVELVGVDSHPAMLERARERLPGVELVQARIEDLDLGRRFDLVIAPSSLLECPERLRAAARHSRGRVGYEAMNPHWLLAGGHPGVRVVRAADNWAETEIDYGGGWTQLARVRLTWPEEVEDLIGQAGLRLELMRGREPEADLSDSASYYVLAATV
jgi:SAM-dependent methyltransferase